MEGIQPSAKTSQTVAITRTLEDRVLGLEAQFRDLDQELRRRFGDGSYSVERSEQVLASIQRLRWAIGGSPMVSPLAAAAEEQVASEEEP